MYATKSGNDKINDTDKDKRIVIGEWKKDRSGLPCFCYTGDLPYRAYLQDGRKVKLPEDPWFLLGNYQMTLFVHASGEYELITGQRAWGRLNQGNRRNSGNNCSILSVEYGEENKVYELTGMDSLAASSKNCKKIFGCGFAMYNYKAEDLVINRNLSVKPSMTPYNGTSAFLLNVTVKNMGSNAVKVQYCEDITANYQEIQFQMMSQKQTKVSYTNKFGSPEEGLGIVSIIGHSDDPMFVRNREEVSPCEGFPPALFMKLQTAGGVLKERDGKLCGEYSFELSKGQEKSFSMIIGFSLTDEVSAVKEIVKQMEVGIGKWDNSGNTVREDFAETYAVSAFADEWKRVLPEFPDEKDADLQRELIWHAYTLEAMATYSEYFKETKIPQGTIYDYDWGSHASARDHFQHAFPLVYYNPALAKSVLRYLMKRTTPHGEIRLIERGCGYTSNERYFTSDQQLFFFLLLAEYLRVTKDYAFLDEEVECCPPYLGIKWKVICFVKECFSFLRDEIGVGKHGIVRLLNSDWNDAVYYIVKAPYNNVVLDGESHMNSAMAVGILQRLIPQLRTAAEEEKLAFCKERINLLAESMCIYRKQVWKAFEIDMGDRLFPRRMYFNDTAYGESNMFLEPQGYTLWIDELSEEKKKLLYYEMKKRLYAGEKLGAREQERPEFEDEEFDKGSRENGGFWWALNGPVILGVAGFDRAEAWRLLKDMTFKHFAEEFPQYWSSYWSAADNVESSLIPEEGLPDQSLSYANIPVFCAHPHAWILYCYFVLEEKEPE